jgi:uroporphyrinogen decarboxylase
MHAAGVLYEHHSCGYITPLIPDMIDAGIDAIGPLNICNDLALIKREYAATSPCWVALTISASTGWTHLRM